MWQEKSDFGRLVSVILRIEGLERMEIESQKTFYFENKPGPRLPKTIIDRVLPHLQKKKNIPRKHSANG
jgi:hypothetical protein